MKRKILVALFASLLMCGGEYSRAFNIISPGDPIVAIDLDYSSTTGSRSPDGEPASAILDGDINTKYLNFGDLINETFPPVGTFTGFIVTPATSAAVQSFVLTTANDAPERDPLSWTLYGTNDPINSVAHSNGRDENWSQIAMGDLTDVNVPLTRQIPGAAVGFANGSTYSSYKMIFPTIRTTDPAFPENVANSMQIADVGFYSSMNGTGTNLLTPAAPLIIPVRDVDAADPLPTSNSPDNERAIYAIDGSDQTKYLNFGKERSGFIVTPSTGAIAVTGIQMITANDAEARDPASWELYGTNEAITTPDDGIGNEQNWTLIDAGDLDLPLERFADSGEISVNNTAGAFTSYRMVFPTLRDSGAANSMQIAEVALLAADQGVLEVNRQTGEVVLRPSETVTLESYEVRSPDTNGLNDSNWNSIASIDASWTETSEPGATDLLSEEDTNADGFTVAGGGSLSLGDIWTPLPTQFEDVGATFVGLGGSVLGVAVEYVGTEIPLGDYSGNGTVGTEDWPLFRAGYGGNYAGLTAVEAYLGGDLDGDFDSDLSDFNLFVANAGGAAALFGSQAVPEPSSVALVLGLAAVGFGWVRVRRVRLAPIAAVCGVVAGLMLLASTPADAQTFTNVGGAPVAISIPADQMDETVDSGPINFFDDDYLDDPGAINDELFVLDYNDPDLQGGPFLQYAGLGPEPKTVFFDYGSSVTANWFAYSQRSGGDPTADRVGKFELWFSNSSFGDIVPTRDPDSVVQIAPTDNRLRDSALRPYSLSGTKSGQYVAMRLTVSELSANQPTNNIGGHEFRLLSGPADVVLEVNRATGGMTLKNNLSGAVGFDMKSINIDSPAGGLDPAGFNGLGGDAGFPLGNGSGNGWEIGGGSNANRLAEGFFSGQSTLTAGTAGLSLGNGYNELTLAEDLIFTWSNADGNTFGGRVQYVGVAPDVLPGDYNDDNVVDAADYTVWRDNLGSTTAMLPNDPTPGIVDASDYALWVSAFGNTGAAAASLTAAAVPEPASFCLALLAVAGMACGLRRSR